jgi:hypothetical protein
MARARTLVLDTKVNVTGADKLNSLGRQFQKAGAALTLGVTTPLTLLAGAATNAASDLNESMNAINVVFGETSDEIAKIGETSAESFGLSQRAFNQAATQFSAFADVVAGEGGNVADVVEEITGRASDFASVHNIEVADALRLFQSGLAGETEPLRKFGIDMSAAAVTAHALATGISDGVGPLTEAEKVQSRYSLLLQNTAKVQGDFTATSTGVANAQRIMAARTEDAAAALGQKFVPIKQKVIEILGKALDAWSGLSDEMQNNILIVAGVAAALGPLLGVIGTFMRAGRGLVKLAPLIGASFHAMLGPIGLVTAAIALTGVAISQNWLGLGDDFKLLQRQINDFAMNFGDMGDAIHRLADETGTDFGVMKDRISDAMEETNLSFEQAVAVVGRGARIYTEAQVEMLNATEGAWNSIHSVYDQGAREIPGIVGAGIAAGDIGDTGIPEDIVAEVVTAGERARQEATRIPFEVSQGILEGRDEVVKAAFQLAEAATDELVSDQRIKEAREKMQELAEITAEEIEAATPATEAARKAELATLEIQLAGYLLRADPLNQEAAALLRTHLESEDPATQQAAEAMMSAVEDRAFIMANNVEAEAARLGVSIPYALSLAKRDAANEARLLADGVVQQLDGLSYDGYLAGVRFHESLAAGMGASRWMVYREAITTASAIRGVMPHSEPDDPNSPLRGITRGFGFGEILAKGLLTGREAVAGAFRGLVGEGVVMPTVGTLSPAMAGAGVGGAVTNNFYLQWDGEPPQGRTEAEIIAVLQRLLPLSMSSTLTGI